MALWKKKKKKKVEEFSEELGIEFLALWKMFEDIKEASAELSVNKLMAKITSVLPYFAYSGSRREKKKRLILLNRVAKAVALRIKEIAAAERLAKEGLLEERYVQILKQDLAIKLHMLAQISAGNVLEPVMNRPIVVYKGVSEQTLPLADEAEKEVSGE